MRDKADVFGNMDVSASNRTTDSMIGELYSSCNHGLEAMSGSPHGILRYWVVYSRRFHDLTTGIGVCEVRTTKVTACRTSWLL
jgi:hypothetical protein